MVSRKARASARVCKSRTTDSAPSAISTPMTMMPTSPTNARHPCSGLGRWTCIRSAFQDRCAELLYGYSKSAVCCSGLAGRLSERLVGKDPVRNQSHTLAEGLCRGIGFVQSRPVAIGEHRRIVEDGELQPRLLLA